MTWSSRIAWFLATGGGWGAIPRAPGTFGTLSGVLLAAAVVALFPAESGQSWALLVLLLITCGVNIVLGPWCERYFGCKDPQPVTIDEVAGYLLTVLIANRERQPWLVLLCAFVAFRLFDIIKLPPAKQAEKLPQGWGVLLDDLVSAIYAGLIVRYGMWLVGW